MGMQKTRKQLTKNPKGPMLQDVNPSLVAAKKNLIITTFLALILLFSFFLRRNTLWLPHWQGDQSHYLVLAMKLDSIGFAHYNLRGIEIRPIKMGQRIKFILIYPILSKDLESKGYLLQNLANIGIHYYDQPLFHKPPGFPFALCISHTLFRRNDTRYTVVLWPPGKFSIQAKPPVFLHAQFYATIVPLFFSLGLILCTFMLGTVLFSKRVGLYAAFLLAINPIDIMISQQILSDDMLSFFVTLSSLLFFFGLKRRIKTLVFISGLTCGIAILTKQTAIILLVALWLFSFLVTRSREKVSSLKSCLLAACNEHIVLFTVGALFVSGFWFIKVYSTYGNPLYVPTQANLQELKLGWLMALYSRPPGLVLYPVGIACLSPLMAVSFLTLRRFFKEALQIIKAKSKEYRHVFLWVIILTFYLFLGSNREHRYLLPVYPAIAVLAGWYLDTLRQFFKKKRAYVITIVFLFLVSAVWSAPLGVKAGIEGKTLLFIPF